MEIDEDHQKEQETQEERPQPEQLRRPPIKKGITIRLMLTMLTILSVLSISGVIGYTTLYHPYILHMHATATVQAKIMTTVHARGTSLAIVRATTLAEEYATATVQAQHQTNYNEITSTTATLNDNLNSPDTYNWDTGSGCSFIHNTYNATVTQKGFFLPCLAKNTSFHNFVYQVDMTIVKGDAGGMIIRADPSTSQSYLFVVGTDGTYSIYYYPGGSKQKSRTLTDGYSNLIRAGTKQENILGVVASGTSLDFYINKQYVTSIVDSSRSSGLIGVLANNYTNATVVTYTSAQVWDLH